MVRVKTLPSATQASLSPEIVKPALGQILRVTLPGAERSTWTEMYALANISVQVDRSAPGKVTLRIWPKAGFTISGLSDAWVADGSVFTRTIVLAPATAYQSTSPGAPCYLAGPIPVTLSAPIVHD